MCKKRTGSNNTHVPSSGQTQRAQPINTPNDLKCIKIAHLNINGLRNKVDLINAELSDNDIICVSETKLNDIVDTKKTGNRGIPSAYS